jgi:glycosyltransferase involved in cell wall biosynthesis
MKIMDRIVFILPSFKTGGGSRVFFELANKLVNSNVQVFIVYPNNSSEIHSFIIDSKIICMPIGSRRKSNLGKFFNLLKTIYTLDVKFRDHVQIFTEPIFSIFSIFLFSKKKYRFIQADDYRIFDDGMILGSGKLLAIYKWSCLKSYKYKNVNFIFNSKFVFDNYCKDSSRLDIVCNLVHPAINHNMFFSVVKDIDSINICLVARKHPLKGLQTFINVWNDLDDKYKKLVNKVYFISHDDLSSFDMMDIEVVRPKNDYEISEIYQKSQIFISTSWREGFGLPPLEAMTCGCACIISDSGGVSEYAVDGVNCLMYQPKNEKELMDKLIFLIKDNSARAVLSMNGIKTANDFSWERSAKQLIDVLDF